MLSLCQFISEDYLKNKKDWIRVTRYGDEGEVIFQELFFNGNEIEYRLIQEGWDYGIKASSCKKLEKKEDPHSDKYYYVLQGCKGETEQEIILIKTED